MIAGMPLTWLRNRRAVIAGLVLALGAVFPGAATAEESTDFAVTYPKQRLPAPGFQLPDLTAADVALEHYRGKVVLMHFWATCCAPCVNEMPDLEALWQRYLGQDLVVLAISADRSGDTAVRRFVEQTGVTFPVLLDPDGAVRNRYEVIA